MPTIPVNLSNVEAFENLPVGEYLGEIEKIVHMEPREAGKFGQLRVQYKVIDGEHLGRTQSEFLSLSPKAVNRLKKWFAKFGDETASVDNLETDDNDEVIEPDLVGFQVIFKVYKERDNRVTDEDADDAYRTRTGLVSVEDDEPAPTPKARKPQRQEIEEADDEEDDEAEPAPARVATAARPKRRTLR